MFFWKYISLEENSFVFFLGNSLNSFLLSICSNSTGNNFGNAIGNSFTNESGILFAIYLDFYRQFLCFFFKNFFLNFFAISLGIGKSWNEIIGILWNSFGKFSLKFLSNSTGNSFSNAIGNNSGINFANFLRNSRFFQEFLRLLLWEFLYKCHSLLKSLRKYKQHWLRKKNF